MELKLFGKSIFEFKRNKSKALLQSSSNAMAKDKFMPDFHSLTANVFDLNSFIAIEAVATPNDSKKQAKGKKIELTPKGVYHTKTLNDDGYKLNCDEEYIDKQLADFTEKLDMIKASPEDMRRGVTEISSVVMRLKNRKRYAEFKDFYDEYPYTTTTKINDVLKIHTNLKLGQVEQFLVDMPPEATKVMKDYTKQTEKLCSKKAVFYIIADKKDFQKTNERRDPILLAQSPFAHVWQILGAWDEEMLFLEEL